MERAERRRQARADERLVAHGLSPGATDPEPAEALSRLLFSRIETAKLTGDVGPFVVLLNEKIAATTRGFRHIPIACRKGCSHCCYIWVSASAPETLYIAKIVRSRGPAAIAKVVAAHEATKDHNWEVRDAHPYPCPMLEDDGACSIYANRPKACRLAASGDAAICERSYRFGANEDIPTPVRYLMARGDYGVVQAVALRAANLPYRAYEFNAGLARALGRADAERAWLAGEDIFGGVKLDPGDVLENPQARMLLEHAFGASL